MTIINIITLCSISSIRNEFKIIQDSKTYSYYQIIKIFILFTLVNWINPRITIESLCQ